MSSVRLVGCWENNRCEIPTIPFWTIHIDMLRICSGEECFEFFYFCLVKMRHDIDAGAMDECIWRDDLKIFHTAVGKEIDWHTGDRQVETVAIPAPIDEIIFICIIRQREEILGHIGVVFIEGFRGLGAFGEEDEIFGDIPGGRN